MGALGGVAIVLALVFDVTRYEGFLLLIGAVFVPLFGVLAADYFVVRRGQYDAGGAPRRPPGRAGSPPVSAGRARSPGCWASAPISGSRAGSSRSGWPACPTLGASLPSLALAAMVYLAVTRAEPASRR